MKMLHLLFTICIIQVILSLDCVKRYYGFSSFVCVCNSTYCNFDGNRTTFATDQVKLITTSQDEFRNYEQILPRQDGTFNSSDVDFEIIVDPTIQRQSINGFGGSFTDAASINIKSLSAEAQENLMRMYFASEGSRYNLVRVPIAGSDFSTRPYSYDDTVGDVDLIFFDLAPEDYNYKLPLMRRAIELCPDELYIMGTPWSPPSWMKTNGKFNESGSLLREMWIPYTNYLLKFFEYYERELGVNLWGFTPQNEPLGGFNPNWAFNTCGWTAENMTEWISTLLGPTLEAAGYRRLRLMIDDFNRYTLPWYATQILSNATAYQYIDGTAVHWYDDQYIGPEVLDETHDFAPDKFILYTEACIDPIDDQYVNLGEWHRGERYITDIIEDSNHWSTGWIDWNMALDLGGGPNWASNFVDSPIIVNATADEFYVQPMYYALNIFSRNVDRNAISINSTVAQGFKNIKSTAFQNPDGTIVLIVANVGDNNFTFGVVNERSEYIFKTNISGQTWMAVVYYD